MGGPPLKDIGSVGPDIGMTSITADLSQISAIFRIAMAVLPVLARHVRHRAHRPQSRTAVHVGVADGHVLDHRDHAVEPVHPQQNPGAATVPSRRTAETASSSEPSTPAFEHHARRGAKRLSGLVGEAAALRNEGERADVALARFLALRWSRSLDRGRFKPI